MLRVYIMSIGMVLEIIWFHNDFHFFLNLDDIRDHKYFNMRCVKFEKVQ